MTRRPTFFARLWLTVTLLAALWSLAPALHAADIEIRRAELEATEEGFRLSAAFEFELTRGLEDAVTRGVPLYFTTDVEFRRPRWYWFDENAVRESRTFRISYNVLTRQYHAGAVGSLQQSFPTLDDALSVIRRPPRWKIAERDALKPGTTYNMSLRMRLDVAQLPKPFQVHAMNSSDWRLSSDWKTYTIKIE